MKPPDNPASQRTFGAGFGYEAWECRPDRAGDLSLRSDLRPFPNTLARVRTLRA